MSFLFCDFKFPFQISNSLLNDDPTLDGNGDLLAQVLNSTRVLRLDLDALDERLTTVGKVLASQVQEGVKQTEKSWVR